MSQAPSFAGRQVWPQAAQVRDCVTITRDRPLELQVRTVAVGRKKSAKGPDILKRAERAEVIRRIGWGGKGRRCPGVPGARPHALENLELFLQEWIKRNSWPRVGEVGDPAWVLGSQSKG